MSTSPINKRRVGVVGGRGVVGQELMKLLARNDGVDVVFGATERRSPGDVAGTALDALILCAPNGVGGAYVEAVSASSRSTTVIIDVSSDHRFDDAWVYGLAEKNRERIKASRKNGSALIANPGCYATGSQLALEPLLPVVTGVPAIFGISGYSGAGAAPSPKNDPARLADNILPYDLVGHTQEREISRHLGRTVSFMPHVASFFTGIALTIRVELEQPMTAPSITQLLRARYEGEPLVKVHDVIPEVKDARGTHVVNIGGVAVNTEGTHAVLVATLDNLLKGAATQAVQNLNLALGIDELKGIL